MAVITEKIICCIKYILLLQNCNFYDLAQVKRVVIIIIIIIVYAIMWNHF